MPRRLVKVTKRLLSILKSKRVLERYLCCCICGRPFREGDRALSVARAKARRKWYCLSCARRYGVWKSSSSREREVGAEPHQSAL